MTKYNLFTDIYLDWFYMLSFLPLDLGLIQFHFIGNIFSRSFVHKLVIYITKEQFINFSKVFRYDYINERVNSKHPAVKGVANNINGIIKISVFWLDKNTEEYGSIEHSKGEGENYKSCVQFCQPYLKQKKITIYF